MKFKVLEGEHRPSMGETAAGKEVAGPGDVVESDNDLCKMFPNKFKRLISKKAQDDDAEAEAVPVEEADAAPVTKDLGMEDVTGEFKKAKDNDLKVLFTEGKGYSFFDGEELLNDKPIKSKPKANAFLDKHLAE